MENIEFNVEAKWGSRMLLHYQNKYGMRYDDVEECDL